MSLLLLLTFVSCALGLQMLVDLGFEPPEDPYAMEIPADQATYEDTGDQS